MIYLDNNDTTALHPDVLQSMLPYFMESFGNPSSLHQLGLSAEIALDSARETISNLLGATPKELVFTSGATEANNIAVFGSARARPERKHLIISMIEHASVLQAAKRLESEGYRVTRLPVNQEGYVTESALRESIDEDTFLVSIVHSNHEIGVVQPLDRFADIIHEKGAWFHTDAAQSIGKIDFDIKKTGVDLASLNSHKIHGPKGVGALYFSRKTRPKRLMEGASQEHDLRPGTENVPGIVGFGKAFDIAVRDREEVSNHLRGLTSLLAERLGSIPYIRLNGPSVAERLPGNLNVTFRYIEGEAILMHLSNRGVAVSSGSACSSKSLVPSTVLTALGLIHEEAHGAIRFSLSRFNTLEEIEQTARHCVDVVKLLRDMTAFVPAEHSELEGGSGFYKR